MTSELQSPPVDYRKAVNNAFSRQSALYDVEDLNNPVLQYMRKQVYQHVESFLKPQSNILELNAGTGIDALHFVLSGHNVHATDLSDGMIRQIKQKIEVHQISGRFTCQQLAYEEIYTITTRKFDYVFSNFGGLNCIPDLSHVTGHLPALLKPGAYITWVIMPPVCLWELLGLIKGKKQALRRLNKNGTTAHVEGEFFQTYYHSLSQIKKAFGPSFTFIKSEGLAALYPPPYRGDFAKKYPEMFNFLTSLDSVARKTFPFNRWADHIIVTFQYTPTR